VPEKPLGAAVAGRAYGSPSGLPTTLLVGALGHIRMLEFPLVPESNYIEHIALN
jgi:hypothetical protein